jgi:hypothetical protein
VSFVSSLVDRQCQEFVNKVMDRRSTMTPWSIKIPAGSPFTLDKMGFAVFSILSEVRLAGPIILSDMEYH